MISRRRKHPRPSRRARSRGVVTVEYAFLLVTVAIPIILGVTLAGVTLLQRYASVRTQLLAPTP